MKTDLDQQLKPNLPFLRKLVKTYKSDYGNDSPMANELEKCLLYVRFLQDRVEQLELYNECFQQIIKEEECRQKKN